MIFKENKLYLEENVKNLKKCLYVSDKLRFYNNKILKRFKIFKIYLYFNSFVLFNNFKYVVVTKES